MLRTVTVLVVSTALLAGCQSRLNPFNWFGGSTPAPAAQTTQEVNPLIPTRTGIFGARRAEEAVYLGGPIEAVTELSVERVPGGAIIRASGVTLLQGVYDVRLTPANDDEVPVNGVLTYRLEGVQNPQVTAQGTAASREVVAARKVTDNMLRGVNTIRVEGLQNARISSR
jgi:hypothetical protein